MASSLWTRRAARMALAPAGAAASLLVAEKTSSKASSRLASKSLDTASKAWWQAQRRWASTESSKPAASAASSAEVKAGKLKSAAAETLEPFSFMAWYEGYLQAAPVRTKMVTGSFLWGVGDAVAQLVPRMASPPEEGASTVPFQYDWERTGRAVFFGFAIHAPASHVHFNFLETLTVRTGLTGLSIPVFKTVMEQFVYWSWISNSMYHGAMGAMQGMSPTQIYDRIADVLWETQKAQWVFWIPVQLLNFRFVPVRHQLNVVLLTSIVWTALLSAWYPPEEKKEEGVIEPAKEES